MNKSDWIIVILAVLCLFLSTTRRTRTEIKEVFKERLDTVIVTEYDTDTVYVKDYEYITKVVNDTVWIYDSPKTYTFNEERYTLDITAVRLEDYRLKVHMKDTVFKEKYVYRQKISEKPKTFTHGIQVGIGYGLMNKKPDLYVGYGFTLNF